LILVLCLGAQPARALTTEALLDTLQQSAFNFFWNEANPANGMVKDRSTPGSVASIASIGFGLSAICVGIDHGWVTREAGRQRVVTTLETLWNGPQGSTATGKIGYLGLYYHWLDMNTAVRTWDSELSTIDTALLFAGILDAREYFTGTDSLDTLVRQRADQITHRANWDAMRNFGPAILMGWKPGTGFAGFGQWIGYNEAMIMYVLALGSPTHPVPASAWTAWTGGYDWDTYYGYSYVVFPPLFGHQYSHCWVDFRNIHDAYMQNRGITYFENSRRATLAAREYCIANPGGFVGYGPLVWGLTASDGPWGYNARGAPPAQNDDGTIAPTAAIGSIAFAPSVVIPTLHHWWDTYRPQIWGPYGFRDAFNLTVNWWDPEFIGIDEGPIVLMIENYRTGKPWSRFMQNADVQLGLQQAGFTIVTDATAATVEGEVRLSQNTPNPFRGATFIPFRLPKPGRVRLDLHDVAGRRVRQLVDRSLPAGDHRVTLDAAGLPSGVYFYRLEYAGRSIRKQCTVIR
jgi:hypothetical protein